MEKTELNIIQIWQRKFDKLHTHNWSSCYDVRAVVCLPVCWPDFQTKNIEQIFFKLRNGKF